MSLWSKLFSAKPKHTDEPPELIRKNITDGKAVMLDVRSQAERDSGHIKDSIFISITELKLLPRDTSQLPELDITKIIYCH